MKVVLIGYRGTGKSSVGKKLAERLQTPFYDTDDLVENAAGKSIRAIVAEEGWPCFRIKEKEIISKLPQWEPGVVATGGGAVMDEESAEILTREGIVVWLEANVETIVRRISSDFKKHEQRPALSDDNLIRETKAILDERIPVYGRLADFSIDTASQDINEVVEGICRFLVGKNKWSR